MSAVPEENLSDKIARLVEEKGWNQEEFARRSQLHRLTVRNLFQPGVRKLHNATVSACARTLGLSVHELRTLPLPILLDRIHRQDQATAPEDLRQRYERATQPAVLEWLDRNPEQAQLLKPDELDELMSLQGTGGPLTGFGVGKSVNDILRRRQLIEKVLDIAGTELLDVLEPIVNLMHEKIQPYRPRRDPGADAS